LKYLLDTDIGAYNSKKVEENLKRIELFKKNLTVLSDSEESAKQFGKIKANLKSKGKIIEDFDILTAGIAIANHCVLITNNTEHFERIDSLQMQKTGWTKITLTKHENMPFRMILHAE